MSSKTTKFKNLLETVPDALVGMDQAGRIRFVNRQAESLFGYDRDDIVGQHIETLLPEPLWQIYVEHRGGYFADPRTRSSGLELVLSGCRQNGTEFPVNISLSHIDTGDVLLVVTAVRDVFEQMMALAEAQRMAAIVEYSDDAIIGCTLDRIVTSWNPAAERIFGYSSEEMIGKSGKLLTPKGRASEIGAILARITAGQHVEHFETMRVRKDGTVFPVSLTVSPICVEGAIIGTSMIARDMTNQMQALASAQRMAAAMVEFSGEAIVGCTLDSIVTSWNPAAERMYGYSSEEMIGKSDLLMSPRDRTSEAGVNLARIRAGQPVENFVTSRIRKNGMVFPVSLTISAINDAKGAMIGVHTIGRDMTKQAEAFEAAQRMATMVEFSGEALMSDTLDGIVTCWNPAAERMYGYSSEEVVGYSSRIMTPGGRTNEVGAALARIRAGKQVEHLETMRIRKDGTVFPVSLTISPIRDLHGAIVGLSAIARDITERNAALATAGP